MSQWKKSKKVESSTLRAYQAQRSVFTNQNLPNVIFSPMALFTYFSTKVSSVELSSASRFYTPIMLSGFWLTMWTLLIVHCHWGAKQGLANLWTLWPTTFTCLKAEVTSRWRHIYLKWRYGLIIHVQVFTPNGLQYHGLPETGVVANKFSVVQAIISEVVSI